VVEILEDRIQKEWSYFKKKKRAEFQRHF